MIEGKPLIRRVYEGAAESGIFDDVIVATDDSRIVDAVAAFGGRAVMTRSDHASGTDRIAEAVSSVAADVIVNVQGDLPFVRAALLAPAVTRVVDDAEVPMGTVRVPIVDVDDWRNPNVVKVVTDLDGIALYFSRAPIPAHREDVASSEASVLGWQHVGIYAYRRDFLFRFASWEPTPLEITERLEQLRALEHGVRIFVGQSQEPVIEVDTPGDLERARRAAGATT
jgi:3-deoxy-manno-octulosonate cytidylyltransferase (CMP-KDO synthetase)